MAVAAVQSPQAGREVQPTSRDLLQPFTTGLCLRGAPGSLWPVVPVLAPRGRAGAWGEQPPHSPVLLRASVGLEGALRALLCSAEGGHLEGRETGSEKLNVGLEERNQWEGAAAEGHGQSLDAHWCE